MGYTECGRIELLEANPENRNSEGAAGMSDCRDPDPSTL